MDGAFNIENMQRFPISLNKIIPSIISPSLRQQSMGMVESTTIYHLGDQDLELLNKFHARTVLTISTSKSLRIFHNEIIKLAYSVSTFKLHVVSHADLDGSAPILNACGTGADTKA